MTESKPFARPGAAPSASRGSRRIFIRDLRLDAAIGAHAHERGRLQPVLINVELALRNDGVPPATLDDVVCYGGVVEAVKRLLAAGHIDLVETLADRILEECLRDRRVEGARVRVEKPGAVPEAAGVGVEVERWRS